MVTMQLFVNGNTKGGKSIMTSKGDNCTENTTTVESAELQEKKSVGPPDSDKPGGMTQNVGCTTATDDEGQEFHSHRPASAQDRVGKCVEEQRCSSSTNASPHTGLSVTMLPSEADALVAVAAQLVSVGNAVPISGTGSSDVATKPHEDGKITKCDSTSKLPATLSLGSSIQPPEVDVAMTAGTTATATVVPLRAPIHPSVSMNTASILVSNPPPSVLATVNAGTSGNPIFASGQRKAGVAVEGGSSLKASSRRKKESSSDHMRSIVGSHNRGRAISATAPDVSNTKHGLAGVNSLRCASSSQVQTRTPAAVPPPTVTAVSISSSSKTKSGAPLRRGKWTVEEEAYVARVIQDFNSGFLNAPAGTTLRSYLSEKLQCDPMRITKKFTGDACIGKRVFHPAVRSASNASAIDKAQSELDALERRWRRRLEMQQRESAKKAAASAAAAAAAAGRTHGFVQHGALGSTTPTSTTTGLTTSLQHQRSGGIGVAVVPNGQLVVGQNVVAQTASWLDRASTILKGTRASSTSVPIPGGHRQDLKGMTATSTTKTPHSAIVPVLGHGTSENSHSEDLQSLPKQEIENQMKEVERLIHEGPIIQQTSAGLPRILDQQHQYSSHGHGEITGRVGLGGTGGSYLSNPAPVQQQYHHHQQQQHQHQNHHRHSIDQNATTTEPADKRLRTGAEDAEALVGFLTAVRASAAAGRDGFAA